MDLWIRSQDREVLLKIQMVELEEFEKDEYWIYVEDELGEPYRVFGVYPSKKRALEILDEIQNLLTPKPIISSYKVEQADLLKGTSLVKTMIDDIKTQNYTSIVYEMPKE